MVSPVFALALDWRNFIETIDREKNPKQVGNLAGLRYRDLNLRRLRQPNFVGAKFQRRQSYAGKELQKTLKSPLELVAKY